MSESKSRFIDTLNEAEGDAFRSCVSRIEDLTPAEQENVCLLMFFYWVNIVLPKVI